MSRSLPISLLLLFVCSVVLGGSGGLVLCQHERGGLHLELGGKAQSEFCADSGSVLVMDHCPPCADFVLSAPEMEPFRAGALNPEKPSDPPSALSLQVAMVDDPAPSIYLDGPRLAQAPPHVDSLTQTICRSTVLRL